MARTTICVTLCMLFVGSVSVRGEDSVTLDNVVDPGPNELDEPLAEAFSLERAVHFLDSASLQWQKQRKCFTCHTNFAYLYARPSVSTQSAAHQEVRKFAEQLVNERWKTTGPRWDAEVIAAAAALAYNDAESTEQLDPTTRIALDRMWTLQREDGGWDWLKCNWPPFEHDDHYGVTLAAIAVGVAPGDYRESDVARQGMVGIRNYLANNAPENLHHRAMTLWASTYHPDLIAVGEKEACIERLLAIQKDDGGWSAATLGNWKREDGTPQDLENSDGYGTGFVIFVLRQSGVPSTDLRIQRGVKWLQANQRASGRWISRSLYKDSKHFLSHAGSAFAVMALAFDE